MKTNKEMISYLSDIKDLMLKSEYTGKREEYYNMTRNINKENCSSHLVYSIRLLLDNKSKDVEIVLQELNNLSDNFRNKIRFILYYRLRRKHEKEIFISLYVTYDIASGEITLSNNDESGLTPEAKKLVLKDVIKSYGKVF